MLKTRNFFPYFLADVINHRFMLIFLVEMVMSIREEYFLCTDLVQFMKFQKNGIDS